jgi:hypothetical protein
MAPTPSSGAAGPIPQRQSKDRTWLWAGLAFVLLSVCGLTGLLLAVSGGQLPDIGNGPSWTPPAAEAGGAAQAERLPATIGLAAGGKVVNASAGRVRLRKSPGFQNKPPDDVIATISAGSQGEVIDGPQQADGLQWWLVRFDGQEGWMAERSNQGILLLDRAP